MNRKQEKEQHEAKKKALRDKLSEQLDLLEKKCDTKKKDKKLAA